MLGRFLSGLTWLAESGVDYWARPLPQSLVFNSPTLFEISGPIGLKAGLLPAVASIGTTRQS